MSKKCITVPKTKEAEEKLNFNTALPGELLEYIFNTNKEFYNLFETSIYDEINQQCNSMIDDFESDELKSKESLKKCLNILNENIKNSSLENVEVIKKIIILTEEAIKRDTGLYFFF